MTDRTCSKDACEGAVSARGLCGMHLQRFYRDRGRRPKPCEQCGSEFAPQWQGTRYCSSECRSSARPAVLLRSAATRGSARPLAGAFLSQDWPALLDAIQRRTDTVDDCWIWRGRLDRHGYPRVSINGKPTPAHRLAMIAAQGEPIPTGIQIHHRCANTACCNPEHLQPVTPSENMAEMHERHRFLRRITALEAALAEVDPEHPLLFSA